MKKIISTLFLALLLSVGANAQVESYRLLRTNSMSMYGVGGASMASGYKLFDNVNAAAGTAISPMGSAGVTFNLRPWIRFNFGVEFSKYAREQRWATVQADGLSYRNLNMLYNAIELTADFNIAQIFREKGQSGPFNVYFGTGIGELSTYGYDYSISMGESLWEDPTKINDNYSFKTWVDSHSNYVANGSPYIPANLSIEYDVTPRFTVGVRGNLKYTLNRQASSMPLLLESFGAVLRVNFVGLRQRYTSQKKQIVNMYYVIEGQRAANAQLIRKNEGLKHALDDKTAEAEQYKQDLKETEASLDGCLADKAYLADEIRRYKSEEHFDVYFANGSYDLDKYAFDVINHAAEKIQALPGATVEICASASTVGNAPANKELSDRRAAAVCAALLIKGINCCQIAEVQSVGELGQTEAPECRRVTIKVR